MNILEQAEKIARDNKAEKERQEREFRKQAEYETSRKLVLLEEVRSVLSAFDGKHSISRDGHFLFKNGRKIAQLKVEWETWENPNDDRRTIESGYSIRWTVYSKYEYEKVKSTGTCLESFAEAIAEYLDV